MLKQLNTILDDKQTSKVPRLLCKSEGNAALFRCHLSVSANSQPENVAYSIQTNKQMPKNKACYTATGNTLALPTIANSSRVASARYNSTEFVASLILYGCSPVM